MFRNYIVQKPFLPLRLSITTKLFTKNILKSMFLFSDAVSTTVAGIPIHSFFKTQSKHCDEIQIHQIKITIIRSIILLCDLVVILLQCSLLESPQKLKREQDQF